MSKDKLISINIRTKINREQNAKKIKSTREENKIHTCGMQEKLGGTKRMENVKPCNIQTSVVTHLNIKHM